MPSHRTPPSAQDRLRDLGHTGYAAEDHPRWHLEAAEGAMDAGEWDAARAALERARETLDPASPDAAEAAFVALRLAVGTVDLQRATAETCWIAAATLPGDVAWVRRAREIIEAAPRHFGASMRAGLLSLLPAPEADRAPEPAEAEDDGFLAALLEPADEPGAHAPDHDDGEGDGGGAEAGGEGLDEAGYEVWIVDGAELETEAAADGEVPGAEGGGGGGFDGHVRVGDGDGIALEDADQLRDHLVEQMLARVTEEEFQILFDTATTFLANGQLASAELMFSAAMQSPVLRVAACEGLMQALVLAGRLDEAMANASRAVRLYARDGDAVLGIVYWQGVAAQAAGNRETARGCYARVAASPASAAYPEVRDRIREVSP